MKTADALDKVNALVHQIRGWRYWLLQPIAVLIRLWGSTLRIELYDADRQLLTNRTRSRIFLFWHNRLSMVSEIRRRLLPKEKVVGLVSTSRDGAWLTAFFETLGIQVVRGSSSRRGVAGMLGLRQALASGYDVAVTPDGPRGPSEHVKPGALWLAERTDAPLLLISCRFTKAWRLKNWDRLYIPKPFSKLVIRIRAYDSFKNLGCDSALAATGVIESQLKLLSKS